MKPATNNDASVAPEVMLQSARLMVMERAPYHTAALMRLVPVRDDDFTYQGNPTFAVTEHGRMIWNPKALHRWWTRDGAPAVGGVIVHEVFHFLLNHAARARAVGANTPALRARWNEAADLSINTMLKTGGWKLPAGALYPDRYGFPEGLTAEAYFTLLSDQQSQQQQPSQGAGDDGDGDGDDAGADGAGKGADKPGAGGGKGKPGKGAGGAGKGRHGDVASGACGGCAGNPGPGEPTPDDGASAPGDMSSAEADSLRRAVAQAVAQALQASQGRGTIPGELQVLIDSLKPPQVPWEVHLRRTVRRGLTARPGVTDYTRGKVSRRQWGVGIGPGKPLLSAMHTPLPEVVFVTDTSGSIGDDELVTAASEVIALCKALSSPLTFMAADTQVSSRGKVSDVRDLKGLMTGRGGTDFRPAFAELERERFTGLVVYATDGDGPAPAHPPRGMNVVWLLFGQRSKVPAPWGTVVRVET